MEYILILHPDGDISINQYSMISASECKCIYHKTYNPGEDIQENLIEAYKKWEELSYDCKEKEFN